MPAKPASSLTSKRSRFIHILSFLAMTLAGAAQASPDTPLTPGQEYVAVANRPNNLSLVDTRTDQVVKTCKLPDGFGPGIMQVSPDSSRIYVLNNHFGDIYGVEVDSCKTVFHASLSPNPGERGRAMFSLALSRDGKELYSIINPTRRGLDHLEVLEPQLLVFSTADGLEAKPVRSFPAPRQTTLIQVGNDGTLYVVGPDVYRANAQTGKFEVHEPLRNWKQPLASAPDVLYVWPLQRPQNTLGLLYTALRFKDESKNPETAEPFYGFLDLDLATGKTELLDFANFTEVYFTGARSPKDPNLMYGVLNHLHKYDIRERKLLASASLEHTFYAIAFNKSGSKLYLGGTFNDLAVFDPDSMKQTGNIKLPGGDMAISTPQIFTR